MRAADIMTENPLTVRPESSVMEAVRLMLQRKFSGLPVVYDKGAVVGIVTEGDLLRRAETRTQKRRPRWIEFFVGPGRLATEYAQACGHKIDEVMTQPVQTIAEDAPLDQIVSIMERHQIKRLPVVRDQADRNCQPRQSAACAGECSPRDQTDVG
jgi:CBS domain-containing protein